MDCASPRVLRHSLRNRRFRLPLRFRWETLSLCQVGARLQLKTGAEGTDVTQLQPEQIALTSANSGWRGFGVDFRREQPPSSAYLESGFQQVIVAVHLTSPGEFQLDDGRQRLVSRNESSGLTFIPSRMPCALSWSRPCDSIHLRFDAAFLESVWAEIEGCPVDTSDLVPYVGPLDERIQRLARDLLQEATAPEIGGRLFADTLGRQAALLLRRRFVNGPESQLSAAPQAAQGIRRAKAFLRRELARDVHLEEVARVAGMSPFHFSREFKRATGMPPHRYLIQQRVLHAESLLRQRGVSKSLAQIAADSGFFDQAHMTRHFRKLLGTTPAALIR